MSQEAEGCAADGAWARAISRQRRYYDFNLFREGKHVEKLRYIHRNPVKRGPVASPEL